MLRKLCRVDTLNNQRLTGSGVTKGGGRMGAAAPQRPHPCFFAC